MNIPEAVPPQSVVAPRLIALCGSAKKHLQSFDAFRAYVSQHAGGAVACVTLAYDAEADTFHLPAGVAAGDVDVVLHKVTGLPKPAFAALERWIATACRGGCGAARPTASPQLTVVDPLGACRALEWRRHAKLIVEALQRDSPGVAFAVPRAWSWSRGSRVAVPVGDAARGPVGTSWWIAKTNESSGSEASHQMVVWREAAANAAAGEPLGITAYFERCVVPLLPHSVDDFIVEEFFLAAVPVVIKVYCVGSHVHIKVQTTWRLIERSVAQHEGHSAPLFFDSQDKETVFSDDGNPIFGAEGETAVAAQRHLFYSWWAAYVREGGPFHIRMSRMAAAISAPERLGLTLFGFDVVLVPPQQLGSAGPLILTMGELFGDDGAATALLEGATPYVIDVNYFPGYSGMTDVNKHLLETISASWRAGRG